VAGHWKLLKSHSISFRSRCRNCLGGWSCGEVHEALLWLSGYAPAVFDAVADAVEPCLSDGTDDPAPFCERCGADIGVFLKFGLDWRHYRGTDLTDIELFDPGHTPVLA